MSTLNENILDVTLLEPRAKHPTIFQRFEALKSGQNLVIHNDHDPKPLYYQMMGELGNIFSWEYLEEGPERWKVKITKQLNGDGEATLGQLAAEDLRKAEVFKKYGLDFCCGGKKTVKEACSEQGIDVGEVEKALQNSGKTENTHALPYNEWSLDFLSDFIVNTHHSYVRKSLPELRAYATKVSEVHGDNHPEMESVQKLVESLNQELSAHMEKEEQILFPFIKQMVSTNANGQSLEHMHCGSIQNPINMMEIEHDEAGEILKKIRKLTNDYTLPEDACASYQLLFKMLDEFETDLHTHIHLENNILFPKALKLEEALL